jgi:hypothetical protein
MSPPDVSRLSDQQQKDLLLELAHIVGKRYRTTPRAIIGRLFEELLSDVCGDLIGKSHLVTSSRGGDFTVGRHKAVESKQTHVKRITRQSIRDTGQFYYKPYFNISDWEMMVRARDGYAFGLLDEQGAVELALVILGPAHTKAIETLLCKNAGVTAPAQAKPSATGRTHILLPLEQVVEVVRGPGVHYIYRGQKITRAQFLTLFGFPPS